MRQKLARGLIVGILTVGFASCDVPDTAKPLQTFLPQAEKGDAVAQYNVGLIHEKAETTYSRSERYIEAVKWYQLSAEQGYALAQMNLGIMYTNGWGVPQDYVRAHI